MATHEPLRRAVASLDTDRALVGVSGGRDSVALLHALVAAGRRDLVVCHLDHALRAESRMDAAFVAGVAEAWGVPAVISRVNVATLARRRKISVETAARMARHAFFARVARARDCRDVILAHHADDQVETFAFNLLRGAGPAGLAAMLPESPLRMGRTDLRLLRPMLGVWRTEIDAYIAEHHLEYREDASNTDPRHTRNRLRAGLLPALEGIFGRDVRRALWRTAEILRAEDALLDSLVPPELVTAPELPLPILRAFPLALQRRTIHAWLRQHRIADIGFEEVERVRSLMDSSARAKVNLPGNRHARRRAGRIFLDPPARP